MQKIFEQPLTKPLPAIRKKIEKKLARLNEKYLEIILKYRVVYFWDKKNNLLSIDIKNLSIKGEIKFTQKKATGYLEIPILLRPIVGRYQALITKEIIKEIKTL